MKITKLHLVWAYINKHPNCDTVDIEIVLGFRQEILNTIIRVLVHRGHVRRRKVARPTGGITYKFNSTDIPAPKCRVTSKQKMELEIRNPGIANWLLMRIPAQGYSA